MMRAVALSLATLLFTAGPVFAQVERDVHGDDEDEIRPIVVFSGPQLRFGVHLGAGAILHDPRWGGFGAADVVLGVRVAKEWSIIARVDGALGGWASQGARFTAGIGGGLGVEHLSFGVFGRGTALALTATGGVWLPDRCDGGACLFFAPMLDLSAAYLTAMNEEPANPLAAWSIGLSAGLGYDTSHEAFAGRLVFFVGHEMSI